MRNDITEIEESRKWKMKNGKKDEERENEGGTSRREKLEIEAIDANSVGDALMMNTHM